MKKLLIFLPVMFIVTLVFPNNTSFLNRTHQINKEINFSIFSNSNYNSVAYYEALASVEVKVTKVNENKETILGKQTYSALQLKQYPSVDSAIKKTLAVSGVLSGNEILKVTYTITYNSNGSIMTFQNSEVVGSKGNKQNINISI